MSVFLLDNRNNLDPLKLKYNFSKFMKYQDIRTVSEIEISHILEEAAHTNVLELSNDTSSALRSFLLQVRILEMKRWNVT